MQPGEIYKLFKEALPQIDLRGPEKLASLEPGFDPDNLKAGVMALPASMVELRSILKFCALYGLGVVPQGGRTGLAGGAVSQAGQVIIAMHRMNRIHHIDPAARVAIVEVGVTLAELQAATAEEGLSPGIDLGARDTATIGGMISTNAGGIEAFRHGVMRARVLGLEAVLADGTVVSDMTQVGKCNEGLDVKQLFIGAEGTLGVVTRAVIKLAPLPVTRTTALVAMADASRAVELFNGLSRDGKLLAFELMNRRYFRLAAEARDETQLAALAEQGMVFIIEMESEGLAALEQAIENGQVADALIAKSAEEARRFWVLREDSWVVDRAFPHCLWFDVTVPLSALDFYLVSLDEGLAQLPTPCLAYVIGHLGDGNLHLTIAARAPLDELKPAIEELVYDGLKAMGGSFSAEHGIGLEKRDALARLGDAGKLATMKAVKQALDPRGMMNPGKVTP